MSGRRWAVAVTLNDTEVRISLHPISLAKLLAECIEDAAETWCRRRGHDELPDGHCARCGRSLPDNQRCWAVRGQPMTAPCTATLGAGGLACTRDEHEGRGHVFMASWCADAVKDEETVGGGRE